MYLKRVWDELRSDPDIAKLSAGAALTTGTLTKTHSGPVSRLPPILPTLPEAGSKKGKQKAVKFEKVVEVSSHGGLKERISRKFEMMDKSIDPL